MNNFNNEEILRALETGIAKGKKAKSRQKIISSNIIGLMLMIITFSVSVNVSSTFASSMKDIPVIGRIVDFIRIGSGYEEVAEQGYFSDGEIIVKEGEYEVSIEGYYYSNSNINVIVKLEGNLKENYLYSIDNVELLTSERKEVLGGSIIYGTLDIKNGYAVGDITVNHSEEMLPEEIILQFDITENPILNEDGNTNKNYIYERLEVNLNKEIQDVNVELSIDHGIEINDIYIDIESLKITPTTMNLTVNIESDSMIFYDFKSIFLKSEEDVYYPISDGVTRSGDMDHGYTYYFKSNYFKNNKSLTLVIDGINALPKDNSTFVIDINKEKVVKAIDENLKLIKIEDIGDYFEIYFECDDDKEVGFSNYNGEHYMAVITAYGETTNEYILKVNKNYINDSIVEIEFWEYPNAIELNEEITIIE